MAYTDDAVLAKLSALNESHDSIATAAQWIMFHRRHADRTVQLWLNRLKESPSSKRLNLIYLANEVTQQSKARHKDDFVHAFSPIIAEAVAAAYKGASSDVQGKLRRVVDVWRDRTIFEQTIQGAVEARLDDLDRSRGASKAAIGGGGSTFNSSASPIPSELSALVAPQQNVSKHLLPTKAAVSAANQEYDRITNPAITVPPAPVHAARLNGLLKTLANAEGAVAECVKARKELIGAIEKMLSSNRDALQADEAQEAELTSRKEEIDKKKSDVELGIMSGFPSQGNGSIKEEELERPVVEELTPPPGDGGDNDNDFYDNNGPDYGAPPTGPAPSNHSAPHPPTIPRQIPLPASSAPGIEMLSNLASQYQSVPTNGANKRRRIESGEDFPDLGNDDGIDADVKEMLRKDSVGS